MIQCLFVLIASPLKQLIKGIIRHTKRAWPRMNKLKFFLPNVKRCRPSLHYLMFQANQDSSDVAIHTWDVPATHQLNPTALYDLRERMSVKASWLSCPRCQFFKYALIPLLSVTALAQGTSSPLRQLSAAFSGGKAIQGAQLTGDATWYAGSLTDSGNVTLTASSDGTWQMQLDLSASGQRTESQTGAGSCQWAGADGVVHPIESGACQQPLVWFLPAFTLQQANAPAVNDLGVGTVGTSAASLRHLQSPWATSGGATSGTSDAARTERTEIGLDPASLLPAVLAYSVHPDNGAQVPVAIEIHYSDYRPVDGVEIPFLIQRYVNGALQLEIHVSSATIN